MWVRAPPGAPYRAELDGARRSSHRSKSRDDGTYCCVGELMTTLPCHGSIDEFDPRTQRQISWV